MATAFLDSSALMRRYYQAEPGANRVREICSPSRRNALLVARFASVEIASGLARRVREGTLTESGRRQRWWQFRLDWADQYEAVELSDAIYAQAERLVAQYPLRALDAIQLACALSFAAHMPRF